MRSLVFLLPALAVFGCASPAPDPVPTPLATLTPAEAHPTALVVDERFDSWAQLAIEDAVSGWCALEPTLCLTVTIGPVTRGQPDSFYRDSETTDCPYYGVEDRTSAQMAIPDSCASLERERHLTTGEIAAHELGHFFGALHIPDENTLMNGEGPKHMARCITAADLAEVCAFHDCTGPRFDLVCSDAEAAASNPFN